MELDHRALVEEALDQGMHVVGALRRLGQEVAEVGVVDGGHVKGALAAEEVRETAALLQRLGLGLGHEVHDSAATPVRVGTAQALHVDLLARDGADDLGTGDENPALRAEDDDVGERGAVRRSARCRAEDDRDLRHLARDTCHGREDATDGVEAGHALAQARSSRVPDPHDRAGVGEGAVVRRHDGAAAFVAHGPALHGGIGREGDDLGAVHRTDPDEYAAIVLRSDRLEGAGIEECLEPHARGARVHGWDGVSHQAVRKAMATSCPPNPKELLSAMRSPLESARGAPCTTSRSTSGSCWWRLRVAGTSRWCSASTV